MSAAKKQKVEFGDFQTPDALAMQVCTRLGALGVQPDVVVEPTCGIGAFVLASARSFPNATVFGFEINPAYLATLRGRVESADHHRIQLAQADFFTKDWQKCIGTQQGRLLIVGNLPWVTNATQGVIGGKNLPEKSNFLRFNGFDAISGKANFDISEWMLLDVFRWLAGREADIAMLVKTAVARKVLAHAERQREHVRQAFLFEIDAKKHFGASVDACLLVVRLDPHARHDYDYTVFSSLDEEQGRRVGHRRGLTVGDIDSFEACTHLVGESPQKWRSGIKHDASAVMEFQCVPGGYRNGFGDIVDLERRYLYPLLKGSDIGSRKEWGGKFVLVPQKVVGEATDPIRELAPKTWNYLEKYSAQLDGRGSTIYQKSPRFAIFGVGDYAFRPWRIAICSLYKKLRFRLVGPLEDQPVMFDDTVYYLSFHSEDEALLTLGRLESTPAITLLSSLIFWDEKRPIKTSILNVLDWSKLTDDEAQRELVAFDP